MTVNGSPVRTERIFPAHRPQNDSSTEQSVVLSLLDATSANFSPTGAVWFLEKPSDANITAADVVAHLRDALRTSLDAYSQWCGRLTTLPYRPERGSAHIHRFGRLQLIYGSSIDPGVELIITESSIVLDDISPVSKRNIPFQDMHQIPWASFVPPTVLAAPLFDAEGDIKPSVSIQLTSLACRSTVLSIKIAHALGDAHTLVHFANDWSRITKAYITNAPAPILSPIFEPSLLDKQAARDIDQPTANQQLIQQTAALPFHRYDWWAPSEGCPWPVSVPEPFSTGPLKPAGNPMPWKEWDVNAPISHYAIRLSAAQIQQLWESASVEGSNSISRHDAVVAHIWSCINRARGINNLSNEELVHCDLVHGLRERMALGNGFLGSPIIMIHVALNAPEASGTELAPLATAIRKTVKKIQPKGLQAHLHSVAYEDSPQRLWQAFLGERHILVTSWAQEALYALDFGVGLVPRYVEAIIPDMDGNIQLKQGAPAATSEGKERKSWHSAGVDISVHLRSDAMDNLLKDPQLFP